MMGAVAFTFLMTFVKQIYYIGLIIKFTLYNHATFCYINAASYTMH